MHSLNRQHILLSYIMIPLGLLIVGLDFAFFSGQAKAALPFDPHSLFIVNLLFGLPHILAGNIQLLDKEYLSFHRIGLVICLLVSFLFPYTILTTLGLSLFIVIETLIAAFHAISQQVGITSLIGQFDKKFFGLWKWTARIAILNVAAIIFVPKEVLTSEILEILNPVLYFSLFMNLITGIHMMRGSEKKIGKVYILSNVFLVYAFYFFTVLGYPFFSILIIRLPHDITAFLFYMNHSTLRNQEIEHNWVVRLLRVPKKVGGYFLPLLVIPLAYFLDAWEAAFLFNAFMAYLHYTTELFIWKNTGPSIKSIRLT